QVPGTVWLVAVLAIIAAAIELAWLLRTGQAAALPRALLFYLVLPLIPAVIAWLVAPLNFGLAARDGRGRFLVPPIAALLRCVVFQPLGALWVLLFLSVGVGFHCALAGGGLLFFGPEGVRTQPLADARFEIFGMLVSLQTMLVVAAAIVFSGLLYLFIESATT